MYVQQKAEAFLILNATTFRRPVLTPEKRKLQRGRERPKIVSNRGQRGITPLKGKTRFWTVLITCTQAKEYLSHVMFLTVHNAAFFLMLELEPALRCLSTSMARSRAMSGVARLPTAHNASPTTCVI